MTITVKATVWEDSGFWVSAAWAEEPDGDLVAVSHMKSHYFTEWADAMASSQMLRAAVERELMDEIHAERTTRRQEPRA